MTNTLPTWTVVTSTRRHDTLTMMLAHGTTQAALRIELVDRETGRRLVKAIFTDDRGARGALAAAASFYAVILETELELEADGEPLDAETPTISGSVVEVAGVDAALTACGFFGDAIMELL